MNKRTIGATLRRLREESSLSVKQVIQLLKDSNFNISDKTLYSYENDTRAMSADMLLELCKIYKCPNILEAFSDTEIDYSIPSDTEWRMIEKYRTLDTHGSEMVDYVLEKEYDRCQLKKAQPDLTIARQDIRVVRYYQRMASAGTGQVVFEDMPTERIEIPDIPEYRCVSYAIGVTGNSMEPLYYDGDILLVETTLQIEVGEIGIFIVDGEAFVKQLGEGKLISLNNEYKDIPLTEYSNCMGRVIGKLEV